MMSEPIPRGRIESLSDLIFGLALSIGALILIGQAPSTAPALYSDLTQFGYSFLVLITVWYRYTRTLTVFHVEAAWAMRLNIALLFLVSIEPFLFNLLFTETKSPGPTAFGNVATSAYALDLAGLLGILALLTFVAVQQADRKGDPLLVGRLREESVLLGVGALMFGASIVPAFYTWTVPGIGLSVRFTMWVAPVVLLGVRRWKRSKFGSRRRVQSNGAVGSPLGSNESPAAGAASAGPPPGSAPSEAARCTPSARTGPNSAARA